MEVDRTKPSTACEPCRKRRAKCSQCTRALLICVGYREELDLFIRDESNNIQRRIQTKRRKSPKKTSSPSSNSSEISNLSQQQDVRFSQLRSIEAGKLNLRDRTIGPPPANDSRELAVNFFLSSFAQGVYLDYLPDLYASTERPKIFEASLEAVAISYFAKCHSRSDLTERALVQYSEALRHTNDTISRLEDATQDATIASVLLLALFAALSGEPDEAARQWTKHIHGAMVLLSERSVDTFDGVIGQVLLAQVISCIQLDCIQRHVNLPPGLSQLYKLCVMSKNPMHRQFYRIVEDLATLRESALKGDLDDIGIVKQALILDHQIMALLNAVGDMAPASPTETSLEAHLISLAENGESRSVQTTNTLHVARMALNELIMTYGFRHLSLKADSGNPLQDWLTSQIEQASRSFSQAVEDISDSVPAFLQGNSPPANRPMNLGRWICSLIWPLTYGAASNMLPEDLKIRVQRQLETFAEISDNPQISQIAIRAVKERAGQDW